MIEGHLPFSLQSTINHQPSTIFANGRSGDLPISPNCRTSDVVAAAVTGGRKGFVGSDGLAPAAGDGGIYNA
jgi:hypothetical protein